MTIDIETFETTPEEELREQSNPERVLQFLIANDDQAFKAAEIAEQVGINRNSISTVLSRLAERELVRHKGDYWAIGHEELCSRSGSIAARPNGSTTATDGKTKTNGASTRPRNLIRTRTTNDVRPPLEP